MKKKLITLIASMMSVGLLTGCFYITPNGSSSSGGNDSQNQSNKSTSEDDEDTSSSGGRKTSSNTGNSSQKTDTSSSSGGGGTSETSSTQSEETQSEVDPGPQAKEYSLMDSYWAVNDDDLFYLTVTGSKTSIVIDVEDMPKTQNGFVYRNFLYDGGGRATEFNKYKKIVFTAKVASSYTGSKKMMVKVGGDYGDLGVFEGIADLTTSEKTFEFSTEFVGDWNYINRILFFPNKESSSNGNGQIIISKLCFSDQDIGAGDAIDIGTNMAKWNHYTGTKPMYADGWVPNGDGFISVSRNNNGDVLSWSSGSKDSYSYAYLYASGDSTHDLSSSGFKHFSFKVTSTVACPCIFKVEDYSLGYKHQVETQLNLTTGEQTITLDFGNFLTSDDFGGIARFCIMPYPDSLSASAGGSITVKELKLYA